MSNGYSKVYTIEKKKFRYNYSTSELEWISNVTKQVKSDNEEWLRDLGRPCWDIVDGYVLIDSIGLNIDNWKDAPKYWCERYSEEINEECYWLAQNV